MTPLGSHNGIAGGYSAALLWVSTARGALVNRLNRFVLATQKKANTWRAFWILVTLGLVAVGAAAPDDWGAP